MAIPQQFMRYVAVGLLALLLDVGCFMLLRVAAQDLALANIAGRTVGALAAYAGNYIWTFISHNPQKTMVQSAWRYALWWLVATALSTLLLPAVVALTASEPVAKLALEAVLVVLNFMVARHWVYRQDH